MTLRDEIADVLRTHGELSYDEDGDDACTCGHYLGSKLNVTDLGAKLAAHQADALLPLIRAALDAALTRKDTP